jgi:hypothetical protein
MLEEEKGVDPSRIARDAPSGHELAQVVDEGRLRSADDIPFHDIQYIQNILTNAMPRQLGSANLRV